MKLSEYTKIVPVSNNKYAVYNTLLCDVIYMDSEEKKRLESLDLFQDEIETLHKSGIIVKSENTDVLALTELKTNYKNLHEYVNVMYLITSNCCNLACRYCFIENNEKCNGSSLLMSKEIAMAAVRKFVDYIKKNKISDGTIIFYGGEPTINYNTIETVLEYLKDKSPNIKKVMVSNGTLITKELALSLKKHNVELGLSIDGPKEINDLNRVFANSKDSVYDAVLKAVSTLKEYNVDFGLSITISQDVISNADSVLDWLASLNIKRIAYNLLHYTSNDKSWEEYYENASNFLIKSHERLSPLKILDGRIFRKINSFSNSAVNFADCAAIGASQITIKPNGDVCVCHSDAKTNENVIGNVLIDRIDDMLKTSEVDFWQNRGTVFYEECLHCEAFFICGAGCPMQSKSLFGDRKCIDKAFCIHSKKSMKWLLEVGAMKGGE